MGDDGGGFKLYHYNPSKPAAIIFTLAFFATSLFHCWQAFSKRARFMIPFIIGGFFEAIGYIGRIQSHNNIDALSPYIMQTLLILIAPSLFAASIYMILGRIILLVDGEKYSLIRHNWLTKIFVTGDVLAFLMQSGGGGILATAKDNQNTIKMGQNVILGGLFLQVLFFGFFIVVAFIFNRRALPHRRNYPVPWIRHLNILYFTSIFILVRCIFRVVEYIQGNDGYILAHEIFLYIFDGLLMLAVMVIMNVAHPGDIAGLLKQQKAGVPLGSRDVEMQNQYMVAPK